MKKFTTKTRLARAAMTLLVALLTTVTAWAQKTLTVYDGTDKKDCVPFNSLYADYGTRCQFIIPANEIFDMAGGSISALTFYSSSSSVSYDEEFTVYLKEVDYTTFATAALEDWDSMDDVYTGTLTISENQLVFEFGSSYTYQGGNLMIGFQITTWGSICPNNIYWYGKNQESVTALYNNANSSHVWSSTYSEVNFIPKTTFTYTPGSGVVYKKPTNLTVSDLTSNGATISWTAPEGSPTGYAYQYKKSADEEWSALATTTETSVSISSLAVATAYNFRVKAVYGTDGESDFVSKYFATECAAYNIPYTYGFEDAAPFGCWKVISGNVSRQSSTTNSGTYRLDFRGTTSNMIALPQFTEPTNTLRVEFYTRPESTGGSSGNFAIGYMTDITDASTFVAVETYNSTEMTTTYVKKTVDFVDTPANAIIAMRQFDCQTNYYWYVDDVTVKAIPSCFAPTALNAGNIATTSADLSWTSNAGTFTVYYKKSTDDTYTEVPDVTNPYTLEGLDPSTYYQFYVVANCSATDISEPSEVFTFSTAINSYPWTENFDGISVASASTSSRTLPVSWNYINECTNNSYKNYPTIYNSSNYANSTPNSLRFYSLYSNSTNYDPQPQYAILPPMTNLADKQVRLNARGYNTSSTFKIGTMGDPTDASTFTLIAEQDGLTTSYPEVPFEYLIPATCTDSYLAIMIDAASSSRTSNGVYIDDIEIREAPTCLRPTDLAVTATTATSATLSWTNGTEGQTAWQICINGDEEHLIDANSNPFTIGNLTAATSYTAKVRACCSETDQSEWSKTLSFTTQCEANTIYPWTENFDDYTAGTGVLPDCWSRINTSTNSSYPYLINSSAHSGSNCLRLYSYYYSSNGSTQPQYAILPPMENLAGKQIMLQAEGYNTTSTFKIGTMSNPLDASTFTMIAEQTLTTSYPEDPFEYLIPADCTDSYVAIMIDAATSSRTTNSVFIDDIEIREAPICIKPTGLAVTANSVTADGATITWTAGGSETSWKIEYATDADFTNPSSATVNDEPTYTFQGLADGTTYYVHVQADCGGTDHSEYSKTLSFNTLQTPANLPYSDNFESTNDWLFVNGDLTNAWAWGEATNNGGTHAIYVSNDGGTTNAYNNSSSTMVYATKTFNFDVGTYVFSYDWKANGESSYDYLRVALVPSSVTLTAGTSVPSDFSSSNLPTGWIALDGGTKLSLQTAWQSHVSDEINIATAGTYMMVFAWRNDNSSGNNPPAAIDNVSIKAVTCLTPTGLAVTANSVTADGATITWTAGGSETSWQIEYATDANFTNPLSVTVNDEPTYTFHGLADGTNYYVHVQAVCGGTDHSEYSKTVSFNTLQTPANLPYSDNFESANGWRFLNGDRTNAWAYGEAANNGGTHAIYVSNDGGTTNAYTITSASIVYATKTFDFDAGTYVFSYDWKANGESTYDYLRVALVPSSVTLTAGTNVPSNFDSSHLPTGWIALDGGTKLNQQSDWQSYVSDEINIATAGTYMMVFAWRNDNSSGYNPPAAIDNVSIQAVTCPTPTNVTISNVKNHSAVVSWESNNDLFNLMLGDGEGEKVIAGVTNPYTLTNLTPETTYSVKVKSVCGGENGESEWTTAKSFTTIEANPVPTALAVSNLTTTTVTLSWTENSDDATEWVIAYKTNADTEYTEVTGVTENPFTLTGLTAENVYTAKVCSFQGGEPSGWSSEISFEPTAKIAIGSGTYTFTALPTYNYNNYSLTQQIYTVAELGEPGLIESIDFYKNSTNTCQRDLDIYMVSTDKSTFESTSDWIPVTDDDLVFSGTVTFADNAWTCITLDDAYIYDGTQNVAIIVDDNTGSKVNSTHFLAYYTASEYQAIYYFNDNNNYDPTGTPGDAKSRTTSKNQIRLMKSPLSDCMKPTILKATKVGPDFVTLSWKENGAATAWVVAYKTNGNADFTVVTPATTDNPFNLTGLSNETEYTVKVRPACDENLWSREITFTTLADNPVPADVDVSNIKHNSAVVTWTGYSDSYNVSYRTVPTINTETTHLFSEDFEGSDALPAGWTSSASVGTNAWTVGTGVGGATGSDAYSSAHGGTNNAKIGHTNKGEQTYLITPVIDLSGQSDAFLKFWMVNEKWVSDINELGVYYRVNGGDWNELAYITEDHTNWTEQTIALTGLADNYQIGFMMYDRYGYNVGLDDIAIYPANVATWQTAGENLQSPTATITGLEPETDYQVKVQGVKNEAPSDWSPVATFTTMPEPVDIELANDATNNATTIEEKDGVYANVILTDRELFRDGYWNTLYLPFSVTLAGSPLAGAEARELSSANISGTTLNLNFSEPVNSLTAGTPYIIKWNVTETTAPLTENDLVFDGVMVYDTDKSFDNGATGDARVRFIGTYDQKTIATEDRSVLFLGADNKLYYPDGTNGGVTIGACRAYFKIGEDGGAGARLLTGFNLNFGDETNAVFDLNNKEERRNNSWYSLDGVKLDGEPTKKGLYIHGDRKVVVK